jgi:hypothetical protein
VTTTILFWCWIALFTSTALPFGIATLCGWLPSELVVTGQLSEAGSRAYRC